MKHTTPVVINGRHYDPATGMPMKSAPKEPTTSAPVSSHSESTKKHAAQPTKRTNPTAVHRSHQQRSHTLNRRTLTPPHTHNHKKEVVTKEVASKEPVKPSVSVRTAPRASAHVPRHEAVSKFAPHPQKSQKAPQPIRHASAHDITRPAQTHPTVARATQRARTGTSLDIRAPQKQRQRAAMTPITHATKPQAAPAQAAPAPKPAKELKNDAITAALKKEVTTQKVRRQKKQTNRFGRWLTIGSASLAVLVLGAYFTYLNMPNLSVKVAAIESGIDAKYPGYRPDGYSLNGPIAFKEGEVAMKFAYNGGGQDFTLSQTKSSWDSSAAGTYANQQASGETSTVTADGLTIYLYDGNAIWVNGGVLYSIRGNAPLSSDQVRRLATSL